MTASGGGSRQDFGAFDFDRLWAGRDRVTTVERSVLEWALGRERGGVALEIGPGGGRLSDVVAAGREGYVAIDVAPGVLRRYTNVPSRTLGRAVADAHRLPFASGVFRAVVLVRVFHFLPDPDRVLDEISRVLAPGGRFVLSYHPFPSVATLVDALRDQRPSGPTAAPPLTRRHVLSALEVHGFDVRGERACGLEDLRGLGRLSPAVWSGLASIRPFAGVRPHHFVAAERRRPT